MTDKYAREMILVPKDWMKPPVPFLPESSLQGGRGERPDPNEAYWKRQYLTDQLVNAPRLDRVMHVMEGMQSVEGEGQPPKIPGYGRKSSEYFRLQNQLRHMMEPSQSFASSKRPPPLSVAENQARTDALFSKKPSLGSTFPPPPKTLSEAVQQTKNVDEQLEHFINTARQNLDEAKRTGNADEVKKADLDWRVAQASAKDIRELDDQLNSEFYGMPYSNVQYWTTDKDTFDAAVEVHKKELLKCRDKLWRQLEREYQEHQGSMEDRKKQRQAKIENRIQKGTGLILKWRKPRGWVQE